MNDGQEGLSPEELKQAGEKAFENASDLVAEAQLLFDNRHWSRTVFLCCIAGEELAKCFMSLSAVINRRVERFNENRYKERFRNHREKTGLLHFFEDIFVSPDIPFVPPDRDAETRSVEHVKLASLYCDFCGSQPYAPSEVISEELARGVLTLAKNRVDHFRQRVCPKFQVALTTDAEELGKRQHKFLKALGVQDEQQ